MKWILIAAAALASVVILVMVVGALLPRHHAAAVRARFGRPAAEIYRALLAVDEFPQWRSGVDRVERVDKPGGEPAWVEHGGFGPIPFVVVSSAAPNRLVTRIDSDELPFGGTWTYVVEAAPDGSTLTITEDGDIGNVLFRFMSKFVFGHHRTMETYLDDLGRKFGQQVSLERIAG